MFEFALFEPPSLPQSCPQRPRHDSDSEGRGPDLVRARPTPAARSLLRLLLSAARSRRRAAAGHLHDGPSHAAGTVKGEGGQGGRGAHFPLQQPTCR